MPFKVTADYLAAVTLKVLFSVLTVALALTAYGCDADRAPSTPVSPSPSPTVPGPPPAPPVAVETWRLSYHNRVTGRLRVLLDTTCR